MAAARKQRFAHVAVVEEGEGVVVRLSATQIRRLLAAIRSRAHSDRPEKHYGIPSFVYEPWEYTTSRAGHRLAEVLDYHRHCGPVAPQVVRARAGVRRRVRVSVDRTSVWFIYQDRTPRMYEALLTRAGLLTCQLLVEARRTVPRVFAALVAADPGCALEALETDLVLPGSSRPARRIRGCLAPADLSPLLLSKEPGVRERALQLLGKIGR